MYGSRKWKWGILAAALAAFGIAAACFAWVEEHSCMGVRILSQRQREAYTQYQYEDLSRYLEFNGEPAAVDVNTSTIYLSQNITPETKAAELPGTLTVEHPDYTLRFVEEAGLSDLAAAVEEGRSVTLLAASGRDTYMEYRVIFTTLPVMRLDGWYSHKNMEDRDVMLGDVCLWAPKDPATGRYSVKTSATEWHVRGGTTASQNKKPWKLALEKEHHKNHDVEFLGMGADDDWILNPMSIDDTKMKEHLFMQLWNTWAQQAPWNHRMSTGQYVELVRNQSYEGVYLLQRRIDKKYLKLDKDTVMFKGGPSFFPESLEAAYDIETSPLSEEDSYGLMEGFFTGEDTSCVDLDNFLDVNLFLQYAAAVDNAYYKNTFYILEKEAEGYSLSLLPWDTDMSWGMVWVQDGEIGGYAYDYDLSMGKDATRQEYASVLRQNPELDSLMARRWQLLRQQVLTEEYILSLVDQISEEFRRSGVLQREWERWGCFFDGADNEESLRRFLMERLQLLDGHFAALQ